MQRYEYKIIDLNILARRQTMLDVLNAAGASGWELISISSTNSGIFRRPMGEPMEDYAPEERVERPAPPPAPPPANRLPAAQSEDREKLRQEMESIARQKGLSLGEILDSDLLTSPPTQGVVKFQDPAHPENTWSGRGRMPKWLSKAIAEGTPKEAYRVRSETEADD
jgi:DNA-binding protein H-NS